jgi:hypothetical protein
VAVAARLSSQMAMLADEVPRKSSVDDPEVRTKTDTGGRGE